MNVVNDTVCDPLHKKGMYVVDNAVYDPTHK